ncbi:MAG: L-dopachrome tautomerase-related protein [Verrucomicrobiota bacterium]
MHLKPALFLGGFSFLITLCQISFAEPTFTVVCQLEERPGNPAVTPDGTIYISMHPFDKPEYKVMQIQNGTAIPYPNKEISRNQAAVIGIQATQDGTLWWLDMGSDQISPKLVGWDTQQNKLKAIHVIPKEVCVSNSFHQDFAIDEKRSKAFIADMSRGNLIDASEPAIVVVDLKTGLSRRLLSGNKRFQPGDTPLIAEGKPMKTKGPDGKIHTIKLGLNPIAIDPEHAWVYFSTMTAGNLFRISAKTLGDFSKSEIEIEKSIEIYAEKPSSDGIAVGRGGKVYITDVDNSMISIADSTGVHPWSTDARLIWPDGVYVAPDESVVVTINQLHRASAFNGGKSLAEPPYIVARIFDK